MSGDPETLARALAADALAWHAEAGVDEILLEAPIDRGAAPAGAPAGSKGAAPTAAPQTSAPTPAPEPAEAARALASGADTLQALKDALDQFEGSSLKARATQAVLGDGRADAHTMLIGEAPGYEEDRAGRPFVGRSGQLLDRMLSEIGLSRAADDPAQAYFVTNVLPYRPLGNRAPEDAETTMLLPFLFRQIELVRPKLVLCLGNAPAKHVMGAATGVTRYRGTWAEIAVGAGRVPALATFHPAYLLRSPEMKRLAWRDLLAFEARLRDM